MTPLEVTVKTVYQHRFGYRFGERACIGREWQSVARLIEDAERDHAAHVAAMLAAAGVVMGVQEWGVEWQDGSITLMDDGDQSESWAHGTYEIEPKAVEVHTRWVMPWNPEVPA